MQPTSGRLVFKIGAAFPVGNPVAVFLVSVSTALNDLLTISKWLVGGDQNQPAQRFISDVEQLYLLRLSIAQLHEIRESVKHARKSEHVASFLDSLPASGKLELDRLLTANTGAEHWIRDAMTHVRKQTNHYGGKWNWDELKWAMKQVADEDGEIMMVNEKLVGMRLEFADHIAAQHLTRMFPEYAADPDAELNQETIQLRLATLFQTIAQVTVAAQNFATAAVDAYLDTLPVGVVRVET